MARVQVSGAKSSSSSARTASRSVSRIGRSRRLTTRFPAWRTPAGRRRGGAGRAVRGGRRGTGRRGAAPRRGAGGGGRGGGGVGGAQVERYEGAGGGPGVEQRRRGAQQAGRRHLGGLDRRPEPGRGPRAA